MRTTRTLALVLSVLAPAGAWAQATATTGQIEGVIVDTSNAVLPSVMVQGRNVDTGFVRSSITDEEGRYRLGLLPLGTYVVTAELQGFSTVERTGLSLRGGETLSINLELRVAKVQETITVTTGSPAIDVSRSISAVTVDTRSLGALPINGRRFQEFLLLTPGAIQEPQRGGISVNGQRGINASYNIDGTSWDNPFFGGVKGGERSNDAYTISQEVIREFQATNAGYAAEFGRSGGGVLSAITKSGTNSVAGTAFWYFRNESLVADDPFGRPPTDFRQHQFGASFGGPIARDRTHFFGAYDQQVRDNPLIIEFSAPNTTGAGIPGFEGKAETVKQTNDIWTFFGRVDHQIAQGQSSWLRYNWSKNEGKNGLGSSPTNFAAESSSLEKDSTHTLVGALNSVLGSSRLNEARFQFGREDRPREPNTTDVTIVVTGLGTIGRSTFLPSLETDDRIQFVDNFTWLAGSHSIRLGTDINLLHTKQPFFLSRSGGEYRFSSVANYLTTINTGTQAWQQFQQGFGRPDVDFWVKMYAFYLQDSWNVTSSLTVNYGLRYEAQINPQPDQPNPALPESSQIPSDKNNWAPRAGFAWDPWGDGRGVIRGNAGIYHAITPALLFVSPITTNGSAQSQLRFSSPTSVGAPTFPNILSAPPVGAAALTSDVNYFDPGFQNPRAFQSSFGIEREVWNDTTLEAAFIYSDTRQLERLFDANLAPPSGQAADGRLLYQNPRPNPLFGRMLRAESTARARYVGTTLSAKRRFAGGADWFNRGLQFQTHYTYGRAKDDDSNERNFSATFYQDWQNLGVEYAWADTDVRHNFTASATWLFAGDVQLGLIQSARSGRPYSLTATNDINSDGTFQQDRQFVNGVDTGRNSFRHPNFYKTDVKIAKIFRFGQRRGEVALDVFNLFNNENRFVGSTNRNFVNNPAAGVPNEQIGGARQAQVSLRLQF